MESVNKTMKLWILRYSKLITCIENLSYMMVGVCGGLWKWLEGIKSIYGQKWSDIEDMWVENYTFMFICVCAVCRVDKFWFAFKIWNVGKLLYWKDILTNSDMEHMPCS